MAKTVATELALPPQPSELEFCILGLLENKEMIGLEMVKASSKKLKRGSIYVTLGRMEEKGYVISRKEDRLPHDQRNETHRFYQLTPKGVALLGFWRATAKAYIELMKQPFS